MRERLLLALVVAVYGFGIGAGWAADIPKRRSSSPAGIAINGDTRAMGQSSGGMMSAPATSAAAGPGQPEPITPSQYGEVTSGRNSGGNVRIDGNTATAATGSGIGTTSTGRGNRGCTSVGGISSGGC